MGTRIAPHHEGSTPTYLRAREVTNLAHLPPSYESRCPGTWFAAPDVQYCGDNPLHFCSQSKNHPGSCMCKCRAIEAVAG